MFDNAFTSEALTEALDILKNDFPLAIWETIYVTLLSTLFAIIIGLPLGVLLVAGEKGGVLPLPKALMKVLNVIINLLRSVPFLILMILVFPLTRLIVGTAGRHRRLHSPARYSVVPVCGASGREQPA